MLTSIFWNDKLSVLEWEGCSAHLCVVKANDPKPKALTPDPNLRKLKSNCPKKTVQSNPFENKKSGIADWKPITQVKTDRDIQGARAYTRGLLCAYKCQVSKDPEREDQQNMHLISVHFNCFNYSKFSICKSRDGRPVKTVKTEWDAFARIRYWLQFQALYLTPRF